MVAGQHRDPEYKVPDEAVKALRARIQNGEPLSDSNKQYVQSDSLLRYYLLARDKNNGKIKQRPVPKAESLLRETLAWRDQNVNGRDLHCPLCAKAQNAHCFMRIGKDQLGRAVFYGSIARGVSQEVGLIMIHVTYALEREIVRSSDGINKWVLIFDLRGMESKHVSVSLGLKLTQIVQLRYREQLAHAYLLDAAPIFDVMYSPMLATLEPDMKRRIEFLHASDVNLVQNSLQLDAPTFRWLNNALTLPPTAALQPAPNTDIAGPAHGISPMEADRDAWERMMARKSKRAAPLPDLDQVEQMLYDMSDEYGLPACDEDLHSSAVKLMRMLSDANQEAHRRRNPQYDESSDRSLAGSMQGAEGSPLLHTDDDSEDEAAYRFAF
eukprot:CAMPEP_0118940262 /NCGR_PEP_ID=MMETSP1169-20130426/30972_1 /TAXON_ID=36882 /ORGANISM="Pyramimonas obovata, Strain CCMP722" /LENGTH=381 /DNA_ID=CAMNT_0006884707 /DNA_START=204 /DNA_END=1346 /DNA_ORIENTATION=-